MICALCKEDFNKNCKDANLVNLIISFMIFNNDVLFFSNAIIKISTAVLYLYAENYA